MLPFILYFEHKIMIKILIVDDHAIVREGLKQILSDESEMVVAGEASTGREMLNKIGRNDYDVVILDISLPDRSGLDVLKQLKCMKPELPVLMLSIYSEEQYAVRVLRAGASGYLTKESAPGELKEAIQRVAQGRKYITSSLAEKLAFELDADPKKPCHEALSDREYQVMCMIASGKSAKEIAEILSLSVKTISTHRARTLKKMNLKNNTQLIRYAIKHHLVD